MTGPDLTQARTTLGQMWGLSRPAKKAELGRILRLGGRDPGQSIVDWESGKTRIPGPAQVAVAMMLAGSLPPDQLKALKIQEKA